MIDYKKYFIVLAIGVFMLAVGTLFETRSRRPRPAKKRREPNPPLGDYKSIKEYE